MPNWKDYVKNWKQNNQNISLFCQESNSINLNKRQNWNKKENINACLLFTKRILI